VSGVKHDNLRDKNDSSKTGRQETSRYISRLIF